MSMAVEIEMSVRDYECDLQGVVNNAVYQNYLEHARHEFLLTKGIDFAALASEGINLMVIRAELDYKAFLGSGAKFKVKTSFSKKSRLKFVFKQSIINSLNDQEVLHALVTGVAVNKNGRPFAPAALEKLL